MLDKFMKYLKERGYKSTTLSGIPSTVYNYAKKGIQRVFSRENITELKLAKDISLYVEKYDINGQEA